MRDFLSCVYVIEAISNFDFKSGTVYHVYVIEVISNFGFDSGTFYHVYM